MNIGNVLYQTEYMKVGGLKPNDAEISTRFYPRNAAFTKSSTGTNITNIYTINQPTHSIFNICKYIHILIDVCIHKDIHLHFSYIYRESMET